MDKPVIIFGANGIGKAAAEIFNSQQIIIFGFLDDNEKLHNTEILDVMVMGSTMNDGFLKYIGNKCEAFVASDDNKERKTIVGMLRERRKTMPMNAVHIGASIPGSASFSHGNFINDRVSIGANVRLGSHNLLHAGTIIDFDAKIGDFVQIGAGSVIGSEATIEDEVFVGAGTVIVGGIKVGKGARIGAGSVVISDVKEGETVFGNPAKPYKV